VGRHFNFLDMFETFTNAATRWVGSTASIILHTIFFVVIFGLLLVGISLDTILLVLTTAVSLEAIYLALFIQRSVNLNTVTLEEAAEDIQGIEENIDEIGEDVDDLTEDMEEVGKDLDELEEDIDQIQAQSKGPKKAPAEQPGSLERELAELKQLVAQIADKLEVK
jgi:low affinity Fe/Cu permease